MLEQFKKVFESFKNESVIQCSAEEVFLIAMNSMEYESIILHENNYEITGDNKNQFSSELVTQLKQGVSKIRDASEKQLKKGYIIKELFDFKVEIERQYSIPPDEEYEIKVQFSKVMNDLKANIEKCKVFENYIERYISQNKIKQIVN